MLPTGLEKGGLFPWVVFIFNHIPLEKKLNQIGLWDSVRERSELLHLAPAQCCLMVHKTHPDAHKPGGSLFPILTTKLCFWHFCFTNTVASEKTSEFATAKKWQPRQVAEACMRKKKKKKRNPVWLWSSFISTQAVTSSDIPSARKLKASR